MSGAQLSKSLKMFGAVALLASAGLAQASVIQVSAADIGKSYTVNYDGFSDGNVINGLTGQSVFKLTGVSDRSFTFDYDVTNTSTSPINESRISIFGFNTDPNILSASSTGEFDRTVLNKNVPSGFGQVDVCFKGAGGNNCSGGGGAGVGIGETGSGTFTLNFSDALTQFSLSDFFVRYQSVNGDGSAIGRGTPGGGSSGGGSTGGGSTGGTPVPAPAGAGLFALAALGLLGARRKKQA
jgi:LPXTG-motif cell wall-anchored protein